MSDQVNESVESITVEEHSRVSEELKVLQQKFDALSRSQAVIEFKTDGTILWANDNFLQALGYSLNEIQGRHHSMFASAAIKSSPEYQSFWRRLASGEFYAGEFPRITKDGREIWIQASYNPICDENGKPYKVIKMAADITAQKQKAMIDAGKLNAIDKSQAVIEFNTDGIIQNANENFLGAMGYRLEEIRGQHHKMFMPPEEVHSAEYADHWTKLRNGQFCAGEYLRHARGGKEIYIQASYNPITNDHGEVVSVVKYASDVTEQVLARKRSEHVSNLMESVAAGSEELNASVREISDSMTKSRDTAVAAYDLVVSADEKTSQLTDVASSMSSITDAIKNIAGQVSLLSLNATIEAARAGEAGRGFAVVANEVKNLSGQAKAAAEQIEQQIGEMSGVSGQVVDALTKIREAVGSVQDYVNSTATAVEEQTVVTQDMSQTMQQAATEAAGIGR